MEPTEDSLRRAQAGDEKALALLVRDVYPLMYRWALVQIGNPDDAEDAAQAALINMHRRLSEFRGESRFTTWLYPIVRRASLDWRRGAVRRLARERCYSGELPLTQSPEPLQTDTDRAMAAIRDVMRGLPARQREVFDLAELQNVPPADIGQLMGLQPSTVRVHLLRARRTIRARLLESHSNAVQEWT